MASIGEISVAVKNREAVQSLAGARTLAAQFVDDDPSDEGFKLMVQLLDKAWDGLSFDFPRRDDDG